MYRHSVICSSVNVNVEVDYDEDACEAAPYDDDGESQ